MKKGSTAADPGKTSSLFRAAEESFGSYDTWKADFVSVGKMRGVGWAVCYRNPANGGLSNHWITLHEVGNIDWAACDERLRRGARRAPKPRRSERRRVRPGRG